MEESRASQPPTELLLAHAEFLSAISARLAGPDADDVQQETWLSAVKHPPADAGAVRAWLARVARNHALQQFRARRRRAAREESVSRSEKLPSTSEIVARENARRAVVEALHGLAEPYRTTLLLRFYEDLPPRDVASRMGTPVETVRTRTKRGLALLREELDRRSGGDRSAWMSALAPLIAPPRATTTASSPLWIGAAFVAASWIAWNLATREPKHGPRDEELAAAPESIERVGERPFAMGASREEAPARVFDDGLRLKVVRADDGRPVDGAEVVLASGAGREFARGLTNGDGALAFEAATFEARTSDASQHDALEALSVRVAATRNSRASTLAFAPSDVSAGVLVLRVAPASSVRGRIVDERGVAVLGARVWAWPPRAARVVDGRADGALAGTESGPDGDFELLELPERFYVDAAAGELAAARGVHFDSIAHQAYDGVELRIVRSWRASGVVLDPAGEPIAGALVASSHHDLRGPGRAADSQGASARNLLRHETRTDERGRFAFEGLPPLAQNLSITARGYTTASERVSGDIDDLSVTLREARTLSIEVVAADAGPSNGVEGTVSVLGERSGTQSHRLVAGRAEFQLEADEGAALLRVDAEGFASHIGCERFAAERSTDARIELERAHPLELRVVDEAGEPVEGAGVALSLAWDDAFLLVALERESLETWLELGRAACDAEGRANWPNPPLRPLEARVTAPRRSTVVARIAGDESARTIVLGAESGAQLRVPVRARHASSGEPVARCIVTARSGRVDELVSLTSRFDGATEFELPHDGVWMFYARADGHAPAVARLDADSEAREVVFELAPERSLRVKVTDARGAPVHPARLVIADAEGAPVATAVSDRYWTSYVELPEHGEALLRGLPAVELTLGVRSPHFEGLEPVRVDLSDERERELSIEVPYALSGARRDVLVAWPAAEWLAERRESARGAASDREGRKARLRIELEDGAGRLVGRWRARIGAGDELEFVQPWTVLALRFRDDGECASASLQRLESDSLQRDFGLRAGEGGWLLSAPPGLGRVVVRGEDGAELEARFDADARGPLRLAPVPR